MGAILARLRGLSLFLLLAVALWSVKIGILWQGTTDGAQGGLSLAVAEAQAGGGHGKSAEPSPAAPKQADPPAAPASATANAKEREPASTTPACTPGELELFQHLAKRREALESRADDLDRREDLLRAAEKTLDHRVAELTRLKSDIERLLEANDQQNETKLKSLVKIYENMKPKDASRIFEELEMETLLSVAERMNERKLAPVLAEMSPTKAKDVTVELARLRRLLETPPTPRPPAVPPTTGRTAPRGG